MGRSKRSLGGLRAAKLIKAKYGKDWFHRIGKKGGNPVLLQSRKAKVA